MTTCCPVFRSRWLPAPLFLATILVGSTSLAQEEDQAAARSLFNQGRTLLRAGNYAEACPKLEAASRLYPSAGILLNLGDCYEKTGRTASAWTEFGDAAALAERTHRDVEAREAARRQSEVEPKLSRLTIRVDKEVPGLSIQRNGTEIASAAWGTPIPVDPGTHEISATAGGRVPWKQTIDVSIEGQTVVVDIPELAAAPAKEETATPSAPPPTTPLSNESPSAVTAPPTSSGLGTLGWAFVGGGAAVGVAGAVLMGIESSRANEARSRHDNAAYDSTKTPWAVGLAGAGVGAAAAIAGVVILVTGSKSRSSEMGLLPSPWFASSSAGLTMRGAF